MRHRFGILRRRGFADNLNGFDVLIIATVFIFFFFFCNFDFFVCRNGLRMLFDFDRLLHWCIGSKVLIIQGSGDHFAIFSFDKIFRFNSTL